MNPVAPAFFAAGFAEGGAVLPVAITILLGMSTVFALDTVLTYGAGMLALWLAADFLKRRRITVKMGHAAFLLAAGLHGRFNYRGDFILLPQEWLYDRGGRRRLRRSAFCRADPAGQPSPALRLRRLFWAAGLHFCRKKRENQRGSRASSMRRSSSRG